jgi:DNA-binding transcriptional ArsR family regulator
MQTAHIFKAIGDPTRQQIVGMLTRQAMGVGEIAKAFSISRPAVAKHLAMMRRCGLVSMEVRGREHLHHLQVDKLRQAQRWLTQMSAFWDDKLEALKLAVEEDHD